MTGTSTSPVMAVSPWLVSPLATSSTLLKLSTTSPRIKYSTLYYHPQHHRVLKSARNPPTQPPSLKTPPTHTHTPAHTTTFKHGIFFIQRDTKCGGYSRGWSDDVIE